MLKRIIVCSLLTIATVNANFVSNGSFELTPDGTTINVMDGADSSTLPGWRVFAVGGSSVTATVTGAAASDGAVGLEYARHIQGADAAIDKWDLWEPISTEPRIYQFLVDVKDGGTYGGTDYFAIASQMNTSGYPGRSIAYDPGTNWETFGVTSHSYNAGSLGLRMNLGASGQSVYLDNVRVVDVTNANRIHNGGFEESDRFLMNWRHFDTAGVSNLELNSDAYEGEQAALLSRTATDGDAGLDLDLSELRVPTLFEESLAIQFASKKVSGNDNLRLRFVISEFDNNGNFLGISEEMWFAPSMEQYDVFDVDYSVGDQTAYVNIAFRLSDGDFSGVGGVGSYLIDSVSVLPEPSTLILVGLSALCLIRRR